MFIQVVLDCKRPATIATSKWFLTCVDARVLLERIRLSKRLAAVRARIGAFFGRIAIDEK